jgi:hypothetical protein
VAQNQSNLFEQNVDLAPGRTRRRGHATSRAGAASVAFRAGTQKAKLIAAYEQVQPRGLTDEQAAQLAGVPPMSCWWKRCNELRELGAIVPTGETRVGAAGVARMVCRKA